MTQLFLKLLNMSITASWIVLAVVILRFLLKKAPKWIICLLWGVVALRLVLPVFRESIFSLIPSTEVIPQDIATSQTPAIHSGIPAINSTINPLFTEHITPGGGVLEKALFVASAAWIGGVAIMLLYSAVTYFRLRRQVQASLLHQKNIYVCDDVGSPFILGILRPRIYIPSGMDENQLQHVLAHENAHIKRRDHWWKPLGFLLLIVYWFNPLLWLAYILLCRDIEQACDEKVIAGMDISGKQGYSKALADCSVHRRMVMACPVAFGEVGVKTRIKGVLNYKKPTFWIILLSAAASVVVAVCFLTDPKPCEHKYYSEITVSATCVQTGVETFTCERCDHSHTEPVALTAHLYDEGAVTAEPTCTQLGSRALTCTVCGGVKTEQMEKTAHIAGAPVVTAEPNCRETGEETSFCAVCQAVCAVETLEINDVHDMKQTLLVEATCSAPGEAVFACTRCGYSESRTYEQLAHNYVEGLLHAGDCRVEGKQQIICVDCGKEQWLSIPKSTEHDWGKSGFSKYDQCWNCGEYNYDSESQKSQDYLLLLKENLLKDYLP